MQQFIPTLVFLSVLVNFFVLLALVIANIGKLRVLFERIHWSTWLLLLVVVILGFSLRVYFPSHSQSFYSDGLRNVEVAKNMLSRDAAVFCHDQLNGKTCFLLPKAAGSQLVYALFFLFFGISPKIVFSVNLFFGVLTLVLVFLIAYLLLGKEPALISTVLVAFSPLHCLVSNYLDNDAVAVFFVLLAFLFFLLLMKNNSVKMQLLAVASLLFALQTKSYALPLLLVFLLYFLFFPKKVKLSFWSLALFLVFAPNLFIQYSAHLASFQQKAFSMGQNSFLGLAFFQQNMANTITHLGSYVPLSVLLIVLTALGWACLKKDKKTIFLFVASLVFLLPPMFLLMGGQDRLLAVPIVFFSFTASQALASFKEFLKKYFKRRKLQSVVFYSIVLITLVSSLLLVFPLAREFERFNLLEPRIAQSSVFFRVSRDFSRECFVVGPEPSLFASSGLKRVSSYDFVADRELYGNSVLGSGCFLYFAEVRDFSGIEKWFVFRVERVYVDSGHKFVFYRITGQK